MTATRCFVQATCALVLFTIGRQAALLGPPALAIGLLCGALVLIAWSAGATRADLGLDPAAIPAGLRYGAGAVVVLLVVLVAAALVPAASSFLHDSRAHIGAGGLLYQLGVPIVLLTAVPEEFAFRGVLLGSALRLWGPRRASVITSAMFGLWHVAPSLHSMAGNRVLGQVPAATGGPVLLVLGSVVVTTLAGLAFCWLRLRSRSLVAAVVAHAATNGLALTVAWITVHGRFPGG